MGSTFLNFIIVGTQRTGSSALGEALGIHPRIACGWEWTQRSHVWSKLSIAQHALSGDFRELAAHHQKHMSEVFNPSKNVLGFRRLFRSPGKWLFHPQNSPVLWVDCFNAHCRWLASRPDINVVHITRHDNLAWLTSKALSKETGRRFCEGYHEDVNATGDISDALRRVRAKEWVDNCLTKLGNSNPYHRVVYDEFRSANRGETQKVVSFLGCDPSTIPNMKMNAKPQSNKTTSTKITNID